MNPLNVIKYFYNQVLFDLLEIPFPVLLLLFGFSLLLLAGFVMLLIHLDNRYENYSEYQAQFDREYDAQLCRNEGGGER